MLYPRMNANLWLLRSCRDMPTYRHLKGWSPHAPGEVIRLRLRQSEREILVRAGTSDTAVVWEVFQDREYDVDGQWPFRTVLDLGANVGIFMAFALSRAGRGRLERYVAVEPDRESFAMLQRQVESQGAQGFSTLFNVAAAGQNGTVRFNNTLESYARRIDPAAGEPCEARTVSTILDDAGLAGVDLLKLDIEGGEQAVLADMPAWRDRVKAIVCELHDPLDPAWFARTVRACGFEPFESGEWFHGLAGAVRDDQRSLVTPRVKVRPGQSAGHMPGAGASPLG